MPDPVTVVVVDDEKPLVDLVTRYLQREGYDVHPAYDGLEVPLASSDKVSPDVVVLDLMLPGLDGPGVAPTRSASSPTPYIVMLTARTEEVDRIVGPDVSGRTTTSPSRSPPTNSSPASRRCCAGPARHAPPAPDHVGANLRRLVHRSCRPTRSHVAGEPVELAELKFDLLDTPCPPDPRVVFSKGAAARTRVGLEPPTDATSGRPSTSPNLRRKLGDTSDETALHPHRPRRRLPDDRTVTRRRRALFAACCGGCSSASSFWSSPAPTTLGVDGVPGRAADLPRPRTAGPSVRSPTSSRATSTPPSARRSCSRWPSASAPQPPPPGPCPGCSPPASPARSRSCPTPPMHSAAGQLDARATAPR